MQINTITNKEADRKFAVNLKLSYKKTSGIIDYVNMFAQRVFVDKLWGHLNECQPYNVDINLRKIVDDKNAMFINRFNKYPDRFDAPEFDYFGMRGEPLRELLPEWDEMVKIFSELGLKQLVDSPCILLTNGRVVLHRDGRPDHVPGYSNRHVGVNYLLFDNSIFSTGIWEESQNTLNENWEGLEYTPPQALIKYDDQSMNMVNTSLPHGSYIHPGSPQAMTYAPRAFITMGFTCSYQEARERVNPLVNFDW